MTINKFPEDYNERSKYILDKIIANDFDARWSEIIRDVGGQRIKLLVMDDALKIDGIRVNVSAKLSQEIADLFDASLPTAMVADMMFSYSKRKALPCPMPISSSVDAMKKHSKEVDKKLNLTEGLASTVGKHWILDRQLEWKPNQACNYGWHFDGPTFQGIRGFEAACPNVAGQDVRVIQPPATAHDANHSDYSQICQLVSQQCWVNDVEMRFSDVLKSSSYSYLISHQGPLTIDRQPKTSNQAQQKINFPIYVNITP